MVKLEPQNQNCNTGSAKIEQQMLGEEKKCNNCPVKFFATKIFSGEEDWVQKSYHVMHTHSPIYRRFSFRYHIVVGLIRFRFKEDLFYVNINLNQVSAEEVHVLQKNIVKI